MRNAAFSTEWKASLTPVERAQILVLVSDVSSTDPLVGFPARLSAAQEAELLGRLTAVAGSSHQHLLLAKDGGGEVVGMLILKQHADPNNGHIADISKAMIRRGLRGSSLLVLFGAAIAKMADERGIEILTLDVRAGSQAQRLWEHVGFKTFGTLDGYAKVAGRYVGGHYMSISAEDFKRRATHYASVERRPTGKGVTLS